MRVYFSNLGCKLNQAELDSLARRFLARGDEVVGSLAQADLHVVNSCTVTAAAARDSRKTVRRGVRARPEVVTVLTGCWASESEEAAAGLDGVDLVVPNRDKEHLVELTAARFATASPLEGDSSEIPVSYVPLPLGPTRGLVKIEDGCNMRCSFCIIPNTRGPQRSRAVEDVVAEVGAMVASGYREIVVTGVQISAYRSGGARLYDLVRALLDDTGVERLRLTSIAPWDFDERLLGLFGSGRLCRHFHFSLQSGCNETLARMRRPYSAPDFAALLATVRGAVPGIAVTTDVIVGFPGESDDEHGRSLDFVEAMAFAKTHVFGYSPRPGTEAATLAGQVPSPVRKERVQRMLGVARRSELDFHSSHLGERVSVLWEERRAGVWRGMTDNYIRAYASSEESLRGRITGATLHTLRAGGVEADPEARRPTMRSY